MSALIDITVLMDRMMVGQHSMSRALHFWEDVDGEKLVNMRIS